MIDTVEAFEQLDQRLADARRRLEELGAVPDRGTPFATVAAYTALVEHEEARAAELARHDTRPGVG